jgi:DNA-binding transcriptional MerR regulator
VPDELRPDPAPRVYTLPELAEICEVDYRTLHNWQKRGILSPSRQEANGSGTKNLFDEADALQVVILAELRKDGVEVRRLQAVAAKIRELIEEMAGDELLVISGDAVTLRRRTELEGRIPEDSPTMVLSLSPARRILAAAA